MLLPRTDATVVKSVAHAMGVPLQYEPTPDTVTGLLRRALNEAIVGAAYAKSESEKAAYNREIIRCRLALAKGRI